jgi:glycosyltransferase involved in cell wall biosynthesis
MLAAGSAAAAATGSRVEAALSIRTKLARAHSLLRRTVGEPPHLCHIVPSLDTSSLAQQVTTISGALPADRLMVSCLCLGLRGAAADRIDPRVQVWSLGRRGRPTLAAVRDLAQMLRRYRVDLVHAHGWEAYELAVLGAPLAGVPHLLLSDHGEQGVTPSSLLRLALPLTRRLLASTEAIAAALAATLHVPRARVELLPSGVDLHSFRPSVVRDAARSSLGIGPRQLVVGASGVLRADKHLVELLEVCARLVAQQVDVRCVIVGDGPELDALRVRGGQLGLGERVSLVGRIADVPTLLATMDVFVHLAERATISAAVLEAMASALPVVAARAGAITEAVRDEDTGLLVPPHDPERLAAAIRRLGDDAEQRTALGASARRYVEQHHDLDDVAERHMKMYAAVLA